MRTIKCACKKTSLQSTGVGMKLRSVEAIKVQAAATWRDQK